MLLRLAAPRPTVGDGQRARGGRVCGAQGRRKKMCAPLLLGVVGGGSIPLDRAAGSSFDVLGFPGV